MSEHQTENTIVTSPPPAEPEKKKADPGTPETRRRSSLSATRHQLTSKVYIATPEESEAYNAHLAAYMEALAPVGSSTGHPDRGGWIGVARGRS